MSQLEDLLLPYILLALLGFIILNLMMNLCLYSFSRVKNVQLLCWYWGSLLLSFLFQAPFQNNELSIILSYSSCVIPIAVMSVILFNTISKQAPLKLYFGFWSVAVLLTPLLSHLGFSFTLTALPVTLSLMLIPLITSYEMLWKEKNVTTHLQKFVGALLLISAIHMLNFALFRMGQGNQLWGWAISFGLYQTFSVALFALVNEDQRRKENHKLQELVEVRTQELSTALKVKETLFRMVLHDIATPISGQLWIISLLERGKEQQERKNLLPKLSELTFLIKKVVEQVRSIESMSDGKLKMELTPIDLDQCLREIHTVFEGQMKEKGIEFKVINELSPDTLFYADQVIFTTSVLGNLISNAIKFSLNDSTLILHAYERDDKVVIDVADQGIGMSEEHTFAIFDPTKRVTRHGTNGEKGTGFGMAQVKSYIEHFGGKIDIKSRSMDRFPHDHGTRVTLTFEKSLGHVH